MAKRKQLAAEIRRYRGVRGWSQREFAEVLGTYETMCGRWERGQSRPQAGWIARLAAEMGVDSEWLESLS